MEPKPFSRACENNKSAILKQLEIDFANCSRVLEIGSGTGQHAVHFAAGLPHLIWQCSDQKQYHAGIHCWLSESTSENICPPIEFCIGQHDWPDMFVDGVFSANTAHIMQAGEAKLMMQMIGENLPTKGIFCQYGPFTQGGAFSSDSNLLFHQKLVSEGYGGYRDLDELRDWAPQLVLKKRLDMPANNVMLVWQKK